MVKYGLVVAKGREKPKVVYINASSPLQAKKKYYGSKHHFKTEASVIRTHRVRKGYAVQISTRKNPRKSRKSRSAGFGFGSFKF